MTEQLIIGNKSVKETVPYSNKTWDDIETLKHEYGHQKQSQMLGWLYLFVIGIPSIVWAGTHQCFWKSLKKHNIPCYWFYTEKWANKLGGVNDENRLG